MAMKKKIFRIHAALAAAFEAWCQTRAIKQEQAAEAALFHLIAMPAQEREDLFVRLAESKATLESELASAGEAGKAVAVALQRRRKAKEPSKRRRRPRSA